MLAEPVVTEKDFLTCHVREHRIGPVKHRRFDENEFAVAEGQTVRIPRGSFHTIRAETLLKVMEIQTGEDIDVDDKIVWKVPE